MPRKISVKRRTQFVKALMAVDGTWADSFEEPAIYDLNYYDLFTRMWLHQDTPLRKTELYSFIPNVSHRTAVKYIQQAIDLNYLVETVDDADRRAKVVSIAPDTLKRLEYFIDRSVEVFSRVVK